MADTSRGAGIHSQTLFASCHLPLRLLVICFILQVILKVWPWDNNLFSLQHYSSCLFIIVGEGYSCIWAQDAITYWQCLQTLIRTSSTSSAVQGTYLQNWFDTLQGTPWLNLNMSNTMSSPFKQFYLSPDKYLMNSTTVISQQTKQTSPQAHLHHKPLKHLDDWDLNAGQPCLINWAPPQTPVIPVSIYPKLLKAWGNFTRKDIRLTINKLKPYKAPGLDGIQNVVLKECADIIINNLCFIFKAILELNAYPSRWLKSLTIMLHKPGKPKYNVAKLYCPIGLLDTIGKLFSTLVAADILFLAEKHQLLLATQFSGWPGHCTTDAMHLITQRVKGAWRKKKSCINPISRYTSCLPQYGKRTTYP